MADIKITKAEWNKAIDEFVEERNRRKGEEEVIGFVPLRPGQRPIINHLITEDLIRIYANAIGDPNPLWRDPLYGRNTRWGSIIVPPVGEGIISEYAGWPPFPGVPGWQQHPAGADREYFTVIRPGDEFKAVDKWLGITEIEKLRGLPHRIFRMSTSRTFINQKDEVACILTSNVRVVARFPGEEEPIPDKKIHHCTQEELDMIHRAYDEELEGKWRRGAKIRYWEDTKVGEELHELILGPYDITDACSYIGALGEGSMAYAIKWARIKQGQALNPLESFIDPETGEYMSAITRHHYDAAAKHFDRHPLWHAYSYHGEANIAHLITNWVGDDAFVKKLSFEMPPAPGGAVYTARKFRGDLAFIRGKVVKKYVENGEHLVDIDAWDDDQDGVRNKTCSAKVRLISRSA